jgi:pimeloyl-ACP methyl ester carboxylesterase
MPQISIAKREIQYESFGHGLKTIVLVHGLGFDRHGWGPFGDLLARNHRVISFDARGVGLTDAETLACTTQEMANDVVELIQALNLDKAIVLGFSMGGMVAQHVGCLAPLGALGGLVLLSSTLQATKRSAELLNLWRDMVSAGIDRTLLWREQFLWANQESFFDQAGAIQATIDYLKSSPNKQSISGFTRQANACIGHDGRSIASLISCPVLVLVGREERVFSVQQAQVMAQAIPKAEFTLLPDGGHNAWLEYPDQVAAKVEAFISTLS